jgi:signal transduction histidine kinase
MSTLEAALYVGIAVASCLVLLITGIFLYRLSQQNRKYFDTHAAKQLVILEKERKRISADLHDELVPTVAVSILELQEMVKSDMVDKEGVLKIENNLKKVITGMRGVILSLSPLPVKDGLKKALLDHIETCKVVYKPAISFYYDVEPEPGENISIQVYRMVQELVHNAMKHAAASRLILTVRSEGRRLVVEFTDNGVGFDAEKEYGSIGLASLKERAILLGGRMVLRSTPGKGTHYYFEIPLKHGKNQAGNS